MLVLPAPVELVITPRPNPWGMTPQCDTPRMSLNSACNAVHRVSQPFQEILGHFTCRVPCLPGGSLQCGKQAVCMMHGVPWPFIMEVPISLLYFCPNRVNTLAPE